MKRNTYSENIRKNIKDLRIAHNYTQQNIADILGVDRTTYTYYERGTTMPSAEALAMLAKAYRVTVGYIIGIEKNDPELLLDDEEESTFDFVAETDMITRAELTKKENAMLLLFRALSDEKQDELFDYIRDQFDIRKK